MPKGSRPVRKAGLFFLGRSDSLFFKRCLCVGLILVLSVGFTFICSAGASGEVASEYLQVGSTQAIASGNSLPSSSQLNTAFNTVKNNLRPYGTTTQIIVPGQTGAIRFYYLYNFLVVCDPKSSEQGITGDSTLTFDGTVRFVDGATTGAPTPVYIRNNWLYVFSFDFSEAGQTAPTTPSLVSSFVYEASGNYIENSTVTADFASGDVKVDIDTSVARFYIFAYVSLIEQYSATPFSLYCKFENVRITLGDKWYVLSGQEAVGQFDQGLGSLTDLLNDGPYTSDGVLYYYSASGELLALNLSNSVAIGDSGNAVFSIVNLSRWIEENIGVIKAFNGFLFMSFGSNDFTPISIILGVSIAVGSIGLIFSIWSGIASLGRRIGRSSSSRNEDGNA